jgi:hypothetical protein
MIEIVNEKTKLAIELAMREIVSAKHRPEGSYVNVPSLYPSGSSAVVRVSGGPDVFFVTDFAVGYTEAEFMGFDKIYLRQAKIVSEKSGIGFDDHAFFIVKVGIDRLAGAIVTVANCSVEAVILAAFKAAEKASGDGAVIMINKLERVFGAERVAKHTKILGASNHEWDFAATVTSNGKRTVFEFATKYPVSVATVAMKMNDISRLESAPKRVVMVSEKKALGTYLGVLSQSANVIEEGIDDSVVLKLAEAA